MSSQAPAQFHKKTDRPDLSKLEMDEHRLARMAWRLYSHSEDRTVITPAVAFTQAEAFRGIVRSRLSVILDKGVVSEDDAEKKCAALDAAVARSADAIAESK